VGTRLRDGCDLPRLFCSKRYVSILNFDIIKRYKRYIVKWLAVDDLFYISPNVLTIFKRHDQYGAFLRKIETT